MAKERGNRLWAEILDRLAANSHVEQSAHKFRVKFGDQEFVSLPNFLQALKDSGHRLKVGFRMQGADIPDLSRKDAGGNHHKVAVPTFGTLNILGEDGRQALFPYVHFELVVEVFPPPPSVPGPRILGDARWYQGVDSIGFFPGGAASNAKWIGGGRYIDLWGDAALMAINDAALYGDVIRKSAADQKLRADGYGVFGNCGDSTSVALHHTLSTKLDSEEVRVDPELRKRIEGSPGKSFGFFPYLINAQYLLPELERRVQDTARPLAERQIYKRFIKTVKNLRDDAKAGSLPSPDAARRALDVVELVWPEGQEHIGAVPHFKKAVRRYLAESGQS